MQKVWVSVISVLLEAEGYCGAVIRTVPQTAGDSGKLASLNSAKSPRFVQRGWQEFDQRCQSQVVTGPLFHLSQLR